MATISGTTTGMTGGYLTSCGTQNPYVIYQVNIQADGTFTAQVNASAASGLQPELDLINACPLPSGGTDFCVTYGSSKSNIAVDTVNLGNLLATPNTVTTGVGTYYLIVTGESAATGSFSGTLTLTPAKCGDGVLNQGEQCDPGTFANGDGCGAPGGANACQIISVGMPGGGPIGSDACPGETHTIGAGTTILTEASGYSTWGYNDNTAGTCLAAAGGSAGGVERVFNLVPTAGTKMTVTVGLEADGVTSACGTSLSSADCWAAMIYARSNCADASSTSELACATGPVGQPPLNAPYVPQTITFPITAGVPVWVFVDGYDGSAASEGPFNLVIKVQ